MKDTILEIFGMEPVRAYVSGHGTTISPNPNLIVGLELEIENFPMDIEHMFGGMTFTTDNSLRNNGVEVITKPVASAHVPALLNAFFKRYNITERNYSDRCSTHCHVNVQNLTLEQISAICLIYQTTERLLFSFIGDDRVNNIYCVPWYQSGLTYNIIDKLQKDFYSTFKRWQKYSALNLIPVHSQGTIEFRHLGGTCDVKKITNWIDLIGQLFNYATKTPLEEVKKQLLSMNTVSNYREWLYQVFGNHADYLDVSSSGEALLAKGVIDSKLMLIGSNETTIPLEIMDDLGGDEIDVERNLRAPQYERAQMAQHAVYNWTEGAFINELINAQIPITPRPPTTNINLPPTRPHRQGRF